MDAATREELMRKSNPQAVKQAMEEQERGSFRPKYLNFSADIGDLIGPYKETVGTDNQTEVTRIALPLKNLNITKSTEALQIVEDKLEITWPDNPKDSDEVVLMVASAMAINPEINWIGAFSGLKQVFFEERVHLYDSRAETDEIMMKDGQPVIDKKSNKPRKVWKDVKRKRWYYHVLAIGGAPKETETSDEPSELGIAKALSIIIDAGEEGIEEATFKGKALRDSDIQADSVLMKQITSKDSIFIANMVEAGKVLREGDKLTVTGN
jgi:hypothetical protein